MTAESRSRRSLLSNGSETTFPLQRITVNKSLLRNKLLNMRCFVATGNKKTKPLLGELTLDSEIMDS
jgi:hypothetical protein